MYVGKYSLPFLLFWATSKGIRSKKYSLSKVIKSDNIITNNNWKKNMRKNHHPKINFYRMVINQLQPTDQIILLFKKLNKNVGLI